MPTGTGYDEFTRYDPLSQVIFVHDYIRLVFHPITLSVFTRLTVNFPVGARKHGELGFCDALVAQIGQRVTDTSWTPGQEMRFHLANGIALAVSLRPEDGKCAEVMHVGDMNGNISADTFEDLAQ
jgi:hypothetical protein